MAKSEFINRLIKIASNELGYLEKRNNSQLDSKTANAGQNNYTKYWRDIMPSYQGQPWCACFVTWCFAQAFGQDNTRKLLKHYPYVYCPTMANLFKLNANPNKGDIVIFKTKGEFAHTGIVIDVNGDYFTTIEGNTSGGSTIIPNGGGVCKKSYYNSNLPGTKFCRPNYEILESEDLTMTQYEELKKMINELNNKVDKLLNPMIYNYIDDNMPDWAHDGVQWCIDNGIIGGTGDGLGLDDKDLKYCTIIKRLYGVVK